MCNMNFKNKISLSNHNRIHIKLDNLNLKNDIINDYTNNFLTYDELNVKYGLSHNTLSKFLKDVKVDKIEKNIKRKKVFKHTENTKKLISDKRKKWLENNPEKHVWKRSNKFKSEPCEHLKKILKENKFDFLSEYTVISGYYYSVDIVFPNVKIGLEINGNQHYNNDKTLKKYYLDRKNIIEKQGWKLYDIHYSKVYDDLFVKSLIDSLNENNLKDVDLSFYIKKKKEKDNNFKEKYKEKIKLIVQRIENSNIDFSKRGWVKEISKIIGIHENKGGLWLKKNMSDFYNENCKKRKIEYSNEKYYYENPKYCLQCGKDIIFEKRFHTFCCNSCSSIYNNKIRKKII